MIRRGKIQTSLLPRYDKLTVQKVRAAVQIIDEIDDYHQLSSKY